MATSGRKRSEPNQGPRKRRSTDPWDAPSTGGFGGMVPPNRIAGGGVRKTKYYDPSLNLPGDRGQQVQAANAIWGARKAISPGIAGLSYLNGTKKKRGRG